jgi:ABC-2 type transport system ATP-binding protein
LLVKNESEIVNFCKRQNLSLKSEGKYTVIDVKEKNIAEFLQSLYKAGITYEEISIQKPTLEDYFIQNSGKI